MGKISSFTLVMVVLIAGFAGFVGPAEYASAAPPEAHINLPTGSNEPINSNVRVFFTSEMNHTSIENGFSITPIVSGTFTFYETGGNPTDMQFSPDSMLSYDTTYTVTLSADIMHSSGGEYLDGNGNGVAEGSPADDVVWSFTTEPVDITPPRVDEFFPHGSDVPVTTEVSVDFDDTMNSTSAKAAFNISPYVSGNLSVFVGSIPGGTTWELNFAPDDDLQVDTVYTVTLNSNVAKDLAGHYLDGNGNGVAQGSPTDDFKWQFATGPIDVTPPQVSGHFPYGSDVPVASEVYVQFDEAMNSTSSEAAFNISPYVSGQLLAMANETPWKLCFYPDGELEEDTVYTVTINSNVAKDLAGHYLDGNENLISEGSPTDDHTWQFTTESVDITSPGVIEHHPSGTGVSLSSGIYVDLNESMNSSSAKAAFNISPYTTGSLWTTTGGAPWKLSFHPYGDLEEDTVYTVTLNSSVAKDIAGNFLDGNGNGIAEGSPTDDYTWSFITETVTIQDPPTVVETLYVGGEGEGNYSNIQDAIDAASSGDTIYVFNGVYYENLVVDKSISLIGEDRNGTIVDGGGVTAVMHFTESGVSVSGFTLRNSGEDGLAYGILIDSDNNTIANNILTGHGHAGIYTRNVYSWDNNEGQTVIGNIISYSDVGIDIRKCNNAYVLNNTIFNQTEGIRTTSSQNCLVSGNSISGHANGIYVSGDNFTISNNTISNNIGSGFYAMYLNDTIIENNTFKDNGGMGGRIDNGYHIILSNNNFMDNNMSGFNFANDNYLGDITIVNNSFIGNGFSGLRTNGNNVTVSHNNISDNGEHGLWADVKSDGLLVSNNSIWNNEKTGIYQQSLNATIEYNDVCLNRNGISLVREWSVAHHNLVFSNTNSGMSVEFNETLIYSNAIINNDIWGNPQATSSKWDNGEYGNFYYDYVGLDRNNDGIGDTPYTFNNGNDNFPLMKPRPDVGLMELEDSDGDGFPDMVDEFPSDPNEWQDTDDDGIGDNADESDDGDDLPDSWEIEHGLNPRYPGDGNGDQDNDGYSDYDEFKKGTDPLDPKSKPIGIPGVGGISPTLFMVLVVLAILGFVCLFAVMRRRKNDATPEEPETSSEE